jgi:hypothetical protein
MSSTKMPFLAILALSLVALARAAGEPARAADDVVREARVGDLLAASGTTLAPQLRYSGSRTLDLLRLMHALAAVRVDDGEGIFRFERVGFDARPSEWTLLVRAPAATAVKGEMWLPAAGADGEPMLQRVPFALPPDAAVVPAERFEEARRRHAAFVASLGIPGRPLFEALAVGAAGGAPPPAGWSQPLGSDADFDRSDAGRTFELFTGGRALQENLQLDRLRELGGGGPATIPIESIRGIEIAAVDWKARLGDAKPALDPLAAFVPVDQLYVGFGSFEAMVDLLDEMARRGDSLVHAIEPRSEDAGVRARLEKQIGLSTSAFARLLGPAVVRSVAFTASDPYLREGSDVAVLFDCASTELLALRLALSRKEALATLPGCAELEGARQKTAWKGAATPDRRFSQFVAQSGNVVIVSNSRPQLERLLDAQAGAVASLGASDELAFFRSRYRFEPGSSRSFLLLTDPFLRRLCGPAWRIGESRRLRCAAVAARLEGARAAGATEDAAAIAAKLGLACPSGDEAKYAFVEGGARCSVHGGAGFLAPIAEVPVMHATEGEKRAYETFRDSYQSYWRRFFDPVALEVDVRDRLALDLTVLPLISGTDYDELRDFSMGQGALGPGNGDPHDGTIYHVIAHVNPESRMVREAAQFTAAFPTLPGAKPAGISWLGESVELFLDDGPIWEKLAEEARASPDFDVSSWFEKHLAEIPVVVSLSIADPLAFTGVVLGLRAFVESSMPNQLDWETRDAGGLAYVVVKPRDPQQFFLPRTRLQLCYASAGPRFWLSFDEEAIRRALKRELARRNAALPEDQRDPQLPPAPPKGAWLGDHASASVDVARLKMLFALFDAELDLSEEVACFANLPVLEEWRRRAPDEDPATVHARHFAVRPVCPAGGRYEWDATLRALACTEHGHPTAARRRHAPPSALDGLAQLGAGVTFEQDGVRIRVEAKLAR